MLSSGCWVHDSFQMLSGLSDAPTPTTLCRCQAATEHCINIAHLVLHSIWNGELSSGKESKKGQKHRARFERTPAASRVVACVVRTTNIVCVRVLTIRHQPLQPLRLLYHGRGRADSTIFTEAEAEPPAAQTCLSRPRQSRLNMSLPRSRQSLFDPGSCSVRWCERQVVAMFWDYGSAVSSQQ